MLLFSLVRSLFADTEPLLSRCSGTAPRRGRRRRCQTVTRRRRRSQTSVAKLVFPKYNSNIVRIPHNQASASESFFFPAFQLFLKVATYILFKFLCQCLFTGCHGGIRAVFLFFLFFLTGAVGDDVKPSVDGRD